MVTLLLTCLIGQKAIAQSSITFSVTGGSAMTGTYPGGTVTARLAPLGLFLSPANDLSDLNGAAGLNGCGAVSDTVNVQVSFGACKLSLPSVLTPDGNGANDILKIKYPFPVKHFSLFVYNRWGQKIFATSDIHMGWDGKFNGAIQQSDGYVWSIDLIGERNVKQSAK